MENNGNNDIEMKDEKKKENLNENVNNPNLDEQDNKIKQKGDNQNKIDEEEKDKDKENETREKTSEDMLEAQKPKKVGEEDNKEKMDIETDKEKEKEKEKSIKDNDDEEENKKEEMPEIKVHHERSVLSLEGAKEPLSMYTRRVMDISKIGEYLKPDSTKGKCGGRNLGNTCFMNSSIACLSNCTELTYYFLKGDYEKDINEENNLGMRGDLAKSWANLMHQYWVEDTNVGDPSDFKDTIGRKAERFRGYGQQDSNEFMSVFLDYLNEDLNRITKKEYIEMKEKGVNESDEECSRRFWECNLRRNDSIITDLFCGQFKSTITCPQCNFINITFDPFDTINLPLLTQAKKYHFGNDNLDEFNFIYVPKYGFRNPICLKLKNLTRNELLKDIIDRVKKEENFIYHDKIGDLLMVDMYQKSKFAYAEIMDSISKFLCSHEFVFSYDFNRKEEEVQIPAYFWENNDKNSTSEYPRMILMKKEMSLDILRKKLYIYLRKYILSPFLQSKEEKDNLSLEMEKYIEDKDLKLNDDNLIELIENEYQEIFKICQEEETEEKMDEDESGKEKDENKENEANDKDEKKDDQTEEENKATDEEKKEESKEIEMKDISQNENNKENKNEEKKDEQKETGEEKKEEEEKEPKEKTKEELLKDFIKDFPFKIYIRKERCYYDNPDIPFIDKDNFNKLSKDFKKVFKLKSFKDTLDKSDIDFKDYEIIVEFNKKSKYINEKTFKLDDYDEIAFEYKIKKKEEPKKEGEEEDGKMTLEKCLKKFCKEEQLEEGDEWYCSNCKSHVLAKKKMELYYLPKILIICFKRFVKDSYRWEKNDDEVEFPINNLDLKNFVIGPDKEHSKYDLFAVSQHYGSTGFGHYTAVCKNDGKWYSYNDSSCSPTSESDAQSSAAYVLFYRRQTD